jgi:hypothetical protein
MTTEVADAEGGGSFFRSAVFFLSHPGSIISVAPALLLRRVECGNRKGVFMAKKDMDQPGTQQGGNVRDEETPGGGTDEVRGIANEEDQDEDFEDTEDLDDEEEDDEDFKA